MSYFITSLATWNFQKVNMEETALLDYLIGQLLEILPLWGAGQGGGVEPPTKFSKRVVWQDLNFEEGLLEKRGGGNFFQVGAIFTKKKNTKIWNI